MQSRKIIMRKTNNYIVIKTMLNIWDRQHEF